MQQAVNFDAGTGIGGIGGQAGSRLGEKLIARDVCRLPGLDGTALVQGADGLHWPLLSEVGLGAAQLRSRMSGIGGSDANTILSGNGDRVMALWREKRGEIEPGDLSDRLPVALGCWTEAFNRQWYEKLTGSVVSDVGRSVQCQH